MTKGNRAGRQPPPKPTRREAAELLKTHPLRPGRIPHGRAPELPLDRVQFVDDTPDYFTRSQLLEKAQITNHELLRLTHRGLLIARYRSKKMRWALYTKEDVDLAIRAVHEYGALVATVTRAVPPPRMGRPRDPSSPRDRNPYRYSREEARTVFRALRAGTPIQQIVIDEGLYPETVVRISRDYDAMTGGFHVSGKTLAALNALPIEGVELPLRDENDVLDLVEHLTRERLCAACAEAPPSDHCPTCTRKKVVAEIAASEARRREREGHHDEREEERGAERHEVEVAADAESARAPDGAERRQTHRSPAEPSQVRAKPGPAVATHAAE